MYVFVHAGRTQQDSTEEKQTHTKEKEEQTHTLKNSQI